MSLADHIDFDDDIQVEFYKMMKGEKERSFSGQLFYVIVNEYSLYEEFKDELIKNINNIWNHHISHKLGDTDVLLDFIIENNLQICGLTFDFTYEQLVKYLRVSNDHESDLMISIRSNNERFIKACLKRTNIITHMHDIPLEIIKKYEVKVRNVDHFSLKNNLEQWKYHLTSEAKDVYDIISGNAISVDKLSNKIKNDYAPYLECEANELSEVLYDNIVATGKYEYFKNITMVNYSNFSTELFEYMNEYTIDRIIYYYESNLYQIEIEDCEALINNGLCIRHNPNMIENKEVRDYIVEHKAYNTNNLFKRVYMDNYKKYIGLE